jgi:glycosyltransferase involved in cell wall biosynthesis
VLPEWSKAMQWYPTYMKVLKEAGYDVSSVSDPGAPGVDKADIYMFMWADGTLVKRLSTLPLKSKVIVFLRRYEYYTQLWKHVDWSRVDKLIFVNPYIAKRTDVFDGKIEVVPNGIDPEQWTLEQHSHGTRIAMVGFVVPRKNYGLALQILSGLPESYELHIAGEVKDHETLNYIDYLGKRIRRKIYTYGPVGNMNLWLKPMNYILSTSISEGCPNNVLEAMAKGIKPVIHSWPGAYELFPNRYVFKTVNEAVEMIKPESVYIPSEYRKYVIQNHGVNVYDRIIAILREVLCQKSESV